jgi:glycosyltransferase involved in cell wall biosynthesis
VRERFGLETPYFLFVGTIEPRKNLPRLFEAFGRFRARVGREAPRLVLAGSRGWRDEGIDRLAAPLGDAVRFLGRVSEEDLVALYNAALGHVLVSLYEGFGLPALEAMACGTPTLVSDTSSLPEVVGDAGLYADPDRVDSIADALWRLWDDAALRRCLGERGRERAAAFTWRRAAERTSEVYARAVACAS